MNGPVNVNAPRGPLPRSGLIPSSARQERPDRSMVDASAMCVVRARTRSLQCVSESRSPSLQTTTVHTPHSATTPKTSQRRLGTRAVTWAVSINKCTARTYSHTYGTVHTPHIWSKFTHVQTQTTHRTIRRPPRCSCHSTPFSEPPDGPG